MGQAASNEAFVGQLADRLDGGGTVRASEHPLGAEGVEKVVEAAAVKNVVDAAQTYADDVQIKLLQSRYQLAMTGGNSERQREIAVAIAEAQARQRFRTIHGRLNTERRHVADLNNQIMNLITGEAEVQKHLLRVASGASYISRETLDATLQMEEKENRVKQMTAQQRQVQYDAGALIKLVGTRQSSVSGMLHDLTEWTSRVVGYEESQADVELEATRKLTELRASAEIVMEQLGGLKTTYSGLDAAYTARQQEVQATLPQDAPPVGPESDEALADIGQKLLAVRREMEYLQGEMAATERAMGLVMREKRDTTDQVNQSLEIAREKGVAITAEMDALARDQERLRQLEPILNEMSVHLDELNAVIDSDKAVLRESRAEFQALQQGTVRSSVVIEAITDTIARVTLAQQRTLKNINALFTQEETALADIYPTQKMELAQALAALAQAKLEHETQVVRYKEAIKKHREMTRREIVVTQESLRAAAQLPPDDLIERTRGGVETMDAADLLAAEQLLQAARGRAAQAALDYEEAKKYSGELEGNLKRQRLDDERQDDEAQGHAARMLEMAKNLGHLPDMRVREGVEWSN